MVVERLIPKKGRQYFPKFTYYSLKAYRYSPDTPRVFYFQYEYWYDGRKFLVGYFNKREGLYLMDAEMGAFAVAPQDCSEATVKSLIEKFKEKLKKSGSTIHEVVSKFKSNNIDLELWLINSLTI